MAGVTVKNLTEYTFPEERDRVFVDRDEAAEAVNRAYRAGRRAALWDIIDVAKRGVEASREPEETS